MKINRLDTHDRLLFFRKQQNDISQGLQECIKNVPDSIKCPFYAYAHSRQVDFEEKKSIIKSNLLLQLEKPPDERLIWMPVVTKPKPTPNSYLFLCRKGSDVVQIIWLLPKRELWDQFKPGQMCFNENIWVSIQNFLHHKERLSAPDEGGPTERDVEHFRKVISEEAHKNKVKKNQAKEIGKIFNQIS